MESPVFVARVFDRIRDILHQSLKGLTPEELLAGPKPPIGWLAWHLSRVQDSNFSGLTGQQQAWISEGWHARFGMPPDTGDYASGHVQTPETVDAFSVSDVQLLLDYHDAVLARTKAYLSTLSPDDLDRVLNEPKYKPMPTLEVRLVSVIADNMRHAGQIEYLRGVVRHQGWFPSLSK